MGDKTDFVIYNDEFWAGMWEEIDQQVNILGPASANTLRVISRRSLGDFQKESVIDDVANLVSWRDIESTATETDLKMAQSEIVRPKINRRIGPIAQTFDAWKKIGSNVSEMSLITGRMVGQKVIQDQVNTGIMCAATALAQESNLLAQVAATATPEALRQGLAKAGDMSSEIVAWVMHSAVFFQIMGDYIQGGSNAGGYQSLENVAGVTINQGTIATLGRPVIVTDSPKLVVAGTTPTYYTLGLKSNAVVMFESEDRELVSETVTGLKNLVFRIQGEYAYNMAIRGMSYTSTGANPNDTALGTPGNWSTVLYPKLCGGVIVETNQS